MCGGGGGGGGGGGRGGGVTKRCFLHCNTNTQDVIDLGLNQHNQNMNGGLEGLLLKLYGRGPIM